MQVAVGIFIIATTTSFFAGTLWHRTVTMREISTFTPAALVGPNNSLPAAQRSTLINPPSPTLSPFPPATFTPSSSPTTTQLPTAILTLTPTSTGVRTVLINEIAWAGTTANSYDEWIELFNPSKIDVNLTGWRLVAEDGSPDILLSGVISSHGYYLLERTDEDTVSDISSDMIYTGSLKNTGEALLLLDPTGKVIDTANLSGGPWPAGESSSRVSMERKGSQIDSPCAWGTNTGHAVNGHDVEGNAINGTPKQANSINFLISEASFTVSITTPVTATVTATTSATGTITATATSTPSPTPAPIPASTATNTLTATTSSTPTILPAQTATNTNTATPTAAQPTTATSTISPTETTVVGGQFVLNEILADPASGENGDANGDGIRDYSQDEFIELVNNSNVDIDISNWVLQDSVGIRHIFPEGTVVRAHCAIIIFGGGTPTGTFGGALTQIASTSSLSLNNADGDTVMLYNELIILVLTYTYGNEGNDNQSITRYPDISGSDPLVKHSIVSGSLFSPGTTTDGFAFSGCDP